MSGSTGPYERRMSEIRKDHAAACIAVLRDRGVATLTELARATGLSRPTVESIVVELGESGLVGEHQQQLDGRGAGRPARQYAFIGSARYVAGVDVGLHTMTAMIADLSGRIVASAHRPVPAGADGIDRISGTRDFLHDLMAEADLSEHRLHTVVAAVSGIVDPQGKVVLSNQVPEWTGINLAARFAEGFGCPVVVENDVNMATMAEHRLGAAQFADDAVFVLLGHRMSAGLVLGGRLYRGHNFSAGELARLRPPPLTDEDSGYFYAPEIFGDSGPEEVMRRAAGGDDEARRLVRVFAERLAVGVASVGAALDPVMIVVGGGVSRAGETLLGPLRDAIADLMPRRIQPALVASRLGSDGVALGALVRAFQLVSERLYGTPELPVPRIQLDGITDEPGAPTVAAPPVEEPRLSTTQRRDRLRIGVVGVGARSRMARWTAEHGHDAQVVAAADPHPAARRRAVEYFGDGTAVHASHRDLLGHGLDAAFVLTPGDVTAEVACDLLRAGVPVYLEQPLAVTVADADLILRTAAQTGTGLWVGGDPRHRAVTDVLQQVVDRGEIGTVKAVWCRHFVGDGGDSFFKDWHARRARSAGLLVQAGVPDIEAIHRLAGSVSAEVVGMGELMVYGEVQDRADHDGQILPQWSSLQNWPPLRQHGLDPELDVEDASMVLMRMRSGVLASYQQCHFTPDNWRSYTVIGSEGRCENIGDQLGGVVRVWNRRVHHDQRGDHEYPIVGEVHGSADADALAVADFLRFVRSAEPTGAAPLAARQALATATAATDSLRSGSLPLRVEQIDPELAGYFDRGVPFPAPTTDG